MPMKIYYICFLRLSARIAGYFGMVQFSVYTYDELFATINNPVLLSDSQYEMPR